MKPVSQLPFRPKDIWIVLVSSMEQIIGTALTTVVGVMIPMMQLLRPESAQLSSVMQGLIGAIGLVGIGVGSMVIGKLSDAKGYLGWFRLCPLLIIAGSVWCLLYHTPGMLLCGLFVIGLGVGGGYSLDSAYISELMPAKWRGTMVGVAKASCAIGFIAAALISLWILKVRPYPFMWRSLILIIAGFGVLTLLMRIRWYQAPGWLASKGRMDEATKAAQKFLGNQAEAEAPQTNDVVQAGWGAMFEGKNLLRVIFSGIPWACEGLGVYGFGVFLPVMVMALGIQSPDITGMPKIIDSVEVTAVVNCFILPGFILGLLLVRRVNHVRMLTWGFIFSAVGLGLLLWAYLAHLPVWVTIVGFLIFEVALNAGPHLVTYIIPAAIYPVADRGAGTGIAAMLGKVGAVAGVMVMPILLEAGGMSLVLIVSIAVMVAGAVIGQLFGSLLKLS